MKTFFKSHVKLCIAVLALSLVTVGATLALMVSQSNSVTNSFTAAEIDTEINEVLTDGDKQVSIKNYGRSDAYVRARIMVSGVKSTDVEIVAAVPSSIESDKVYLVMQNNGDSSGKWTKEAVAANDTYSDAFYYYLDVLPGTDSTQDEDERKTSDLLTKVVLGSKLEEDQDFLEKFSVTIYHESVLAINQPAEGEPVTLNMVTNAFTAAENSAS